MSSIPRNTKVVEGSEAVALAVSACKPEVISAYPISPQTHIVETLARMVASGEFQCEYIRVESEFSAASVLTGASAAGSRCYTASSSQGLLLMTEVLYASVGQRLPFVITGVNRSISAPISIQIDQRDTMSLRDSGMIQLYAESSQEAYDLHLAAFKIAEDPDILLPVMVCMDGWVLTHSYEPVTFVEKTDVASFLPPFKPENMLDPNDPKTWGSYSEAHNQLELNYSVHDAMLYSKKRINEIMTELSELTGRAYEGMIQPYRCDDAEIIFVALGSVCGTIKDAVDDLRNMGKKVGLIKLRCHRPFPYEDILSVIKDAKAVAVVEANFSMGSEGAIALDLKAKLCNKTDAPLVVDFIAGIGGREVNKNTVAHIAAKAGEIADSGVPLAEPYWVDLDRNILP